MRSDVYLQEYAWQLLNICPKYCILDFICQTLLFLFINLGCWDAVRLTSVVHFDSRFLFGAVELGSEFHVEHFLSGPPFPLTGTLGETFGFYGALLSNFKQQFLENIWRSAWEFCKVGAFICPAEGGSSLQEAAPPLQTAWMAAAGSFSAGADVIPRLKAKITL
ncbi:uncharacterized protein J5F26_009492 isoform 1-T3 [Ciconia maguari]